jgi:hypothetical protein
MQLQPIDLTAVLGVVMGTSIVLIPIIGLTARFALKPTVEAFARVFEGRGRDEAVQLLERRVALLEQQVEVMESSFGRFEETSRFDVQLRSGEGDKPDQIPPPQPRPDRLGDSPPESP